MAVILPLKDNHAREQDCEDRHHEDDWHRIQDRERQDADEHLRGILGNHMVQQVGQDGLVVEPQETVKEVVMGLVRAGKPPQPAISRSQAQMQPEVDGIEDERRNHEKCRALHYQALKRFP